MTSVLLIILRNTIKYTSFKKRQQQEEEIRLDQEIKIIENDVIVNFINMSEET